MCDVFRTPLFLLIFKLTMLLLENNKLKQYILQNLEQEEIVAVFLDVPLEDVKYCLKHKSNKICNPLRDDTHPSLGMQWVIDNATRLPKIRLHDFADPIYRGDCFDLVGWRTPYNPNNKQDFIRICKAIISYGTKQIIRMTPGSKPHVVITKQMTTIDIQPRSWNSYDGKIWNKWFVTFAQLTAEKCIPVEYAWINSDTPNYQYKVNDPCYAYFIGVDVVHKTPIYQLYFPLRKRTVKTKPRFITNNGYALLDVDSFKKYDILFLIKSKKDKIVINSMLSDPVTMELKTLLEENKDITFELRALSSETPTITANQNKILQKFYKHIFVYTDFDRAGRHTAYYYKKHFGYHPLHMTNGTFDTEDYGSKDISDYTNVNGRRFGELLLVKAIKHVLNTVYQFDDIINY